MIVDSGKYFLYRHIRLDKNEPFYIGVGTKKSYIKNWEAPSAYSRATEKGGRNKIWRNIVKKTKYEVEVLLESDNEDFIFEKEIEFIKLYGRINLKTGILANLTDGGRGTKCLIPSLKSKIATSIRAKGNTYRRGVKLSKETKAIISASQLGRKLLPESIEKRTKTRQLKGNWHTKNSKDKIGKSNSKKLMRQNLIDNNIEYYDSCHAASNIIGLSYQRISELCKNNMTMKGYKWSYVKN
jgi:hypothetical protein